MRSTLPDLRMVRLHQVFGLERLDHQGDDHWPLFDNLIRETPANALIAIDARQLIYLGYSYAKATIRQALLRRIAEEYGSRRLILIADQGEKFLDGIDAALREKNLFMLVAASEHAIDEAGLIGQVPDYLRNTFDLVRRLAPVTTGALARSMDQTPQNTKNRLDRLFEMGLIRREKIASPSGGLEWLNWVL